MLQAQFINKTDFTCRDVDFPPVPHHPHPTKIALKLNVPGF